MDVFVEQLLALPGSANKYNQESGRMGFSLGWLGYSLLFPIHTNKLRSYGSKLVGKTSPECPEHSPKLGAQLPRNSFCHPGEYAWASEGVQLSVEDIYK